MTIHIIRNPDGALAPIETSTRKYKRTRRRIVANTDTLCRGELNNVYVRQKLKKSDYILVDVRDGAIVGFAALTFMGRRTLRVIVLCSSVAGAGSGLQRAIEDFARGAGVHKLVLKALPTAAGFYERMGYVLDLNTGMPDTNVEEDFANNNSNNSFSGLGPVPMSKQTKSRRG
jgi:hypothetical protein